MSKPARCRPPWKRACSILTQRLDLALVRCVAQIFGALKKLRILKVKSSGTSQSHHNHLAVLNGFRFGQAIDPEIDKLLGQKPGAHLELCLRYHKGQHTFLFQPAVGVFEEDRFQALVALLPDLKIIRWIEIEQGHRFNLAAHS